ncbi:MAG: CAP domain-containing protein [Desulfobulbus sp.]|nr:CAP domain-containing protein [Desulfobulbus sp.]
MRLLLMPIAVLLLLASLLQPVTAHSRAQDDQSLSPYAATLLEQVNNYRRYSNLAPLRADARLNQLARTHSFEMFRQKRMGHSGFNDRFRRSGSRMCVENVGWNYSTPLKQFDAWRHSRGHDENMLNEDIRYAGIAEIGKYVTFFACH